METHATLICKMELVIYTIGDKIGMFTSICNVGIRLYLIVFLVVIELEDHVVPVGIDFLWCSTYHKYLMFSLQHTLKWLDSKDAATKCHARLNISKTCHMTFTITQQINTVIIIILSSI